ncbi:MAG: Uncharacterized protein Athens071425_317 [Parcubacteria group bacterium Athens0714_25]|nr:MAG: Uncharacterized protein Athens071425_317 [Parcubacteria group bacterium Athens0714_25]
MSMTSEKKWKKRIKEIFSKYESKIVIFLGMILVAVIAFEMGILQGQKWQQSPMIVEVPAVAVASGQSDSEINDGAKEIENNNQQDAGNENLEKCLFVASKNSDKYHPATNCHWADQIKKENKVCFSSEQEAENKGYVKSSCFK